MDVEDEEEVLTEELFKEDLTNKKYQLLLVNK